MNNIDLKIEKYIKKFNLKGYKFEDKYFDKNNKNKELKKYFKKPIGLYDPFGININPLTGNEYENLYKNDKPLLYKKDPLIGVQAPVTYRNLACNWVDLIIYQNVNDILNSIRDNQITIIQAGTGVGKTVIVPKIALQVFNFQKKVVCTVPKQIIAKNNAVYSAKCLDVKLGEHVGYYYMGKNETSSKTMLTFTTPGSLKSTLTGGDPLLSNYSCIIIDEVHERSIQTDQLLLLIKDILVKRPDFRVVLLSATIKLSDFKKYYTDLPNNFTYNELDIPGKTFDVDIYYLEKPVLDWKKEALNRIINILKTTNSGDILVFIKSGGEGKMLCDDIKKNIKNVPNINPFCIVLESKMNDKDKEYATSEFAYLSHYDMDPNNPFTRKIVMATNVAESSITVDGIIYVIDNGFSLESSYYPKEDAHSLIEERISQASAKQRKGRAGRTTNGICYRMYTENEYNKFRDYPLPDVQKTDITSDILDAFSLPYINNVRDLRELYLNKLLSIPSDDFIKSSLNKLYGLNAITGSDDMGTITDIGKALGKFRAVEPNFAKAILASYYYYCKHDVVNIILISMEIDGRMELLFEKYRPSSKNLSKKEMEKEESVFLRKQKYFYSQYGDYLTMLNVYYNVKNFIGDNNLVNKTQARNWCKENGIRYNVFFLRSFNKAGDRWDLIGEKSMKINFTLQKIINPPELKKKYYNEYKNDGGMENIRDINNEIKNKKNVIIDFDENVNNKIMLTGGYNAKPYEINLFPDAKPVSSKEMNILMALSIGNITNYAVLVNKNKGIYKTCFPIEKIFCNFDKNTTFHPKVYPNIIMYHELFKTRMDQPILKLKLITKIPLDILNKIKADYSQFIKTCFQKQNNYKDKSYGDKKFKKDKTYGDKKFSKKKIDTKFKKK